MSAQQPQLAPGQRVRVTAPSAGLNERIATVEALSAHDITLRYERFRRPEWTDTLYLTVPLDSLRRVDVSVAQHSQQGVFALGGAVVGGAVISS